MDLKRMKQLAGLNEAKEEGMQPLEKSDAGKKSAVEAIKKGIPPGTEHETEDHDVVLDDRGNVKVSNEKVITKTGGEPAKVTAPGKLKLKEAFFELLENSVAAAKAKRDGDRKAAEELHKKEASDLNFTSYGAWAAAVKKRGGTIDGDSENATAHAGDHRIGDWDAEDGGIVHRV
jgi:hypothetical protein